MRRILHLDMDAFYASVEQRDNPELRGRPVVVGGAPDQRGVVAAASYEARAFGVRSAIPMSRAVRLCPALVIVRPDFTKYRQVSQQVFALYREVTPLVEPLSLDEAYLDVTENAWGEPLGVEVARRLKAAIRAATGLTASAGVAPNKFLAKIASGWQKPDGLTVIAPERVERFLQGLPVDALWGVGPVTAKKLQAHGITRLVDVRAADLETLRGLVGSLADWLKDLAAGRDARPVEPDRPLEVGRIGVHLRARPHGAGRDPPRDRRDGRRRGGVAANAAGSSRAPSSSRCATATSRPSPAATAPSRRATRRRYRHAPRPCSTKTDAGAPAGAAARRQRAQSVRHRGPGAARPADPARSPAALRRRSTTGACSRSSCDRAPSGLHDADAAQHHVLHRRLAVHRHGLDGLHHLESPARPCRTPCTCRRASPPAPSR